MSTICVRFERIEWEREEVEQALSNDPLLIYGQTVAGEARYVYYGESDSGRLLALVVTERKEKIR